MMESPNVGGKDTTRIFVVVCNSYKYSSMTLIRTV